jgi:formate hydrogenlyase subunit 6/NADH:ubiquinone oxidoreductase subunit I
MKRPGKMAAEVLTEFMHKPATISYPAQSVKMPVGFRGKLKFRASRCIGCKLCMRDCPSGAIQINKIGDKQFEAILSLDKCVFCGQCVDSCNKDALEMSVEYELASLDRSKLIVNINIEDPIQPPAVVKTPLPADGPVPAGCDDKNVPVPTQGPTSAAPADKADNGSGEKV